MMVGLDEATAEPLHASLSSSNKDILINSSDDEIAPQESVNFHSN